MPGAAFVQTPVVGTTARALVDRHEHGQSDEDRRRLGSHATPASLARVLVDVAFGTLGRIPRLVADPACGAGAFLLAAADALAAAGVAPVDVVSQRVVGCDVDPVAVAAARAALNCWAEEHGIPSGSVAPRVRVADALIEDPEWAGAVDVVVGNPPFLAQRTSDTARSSADRAAVRARYGEVGPYTDASALFLLCAVDLLAADGVAVLIQPQSVLSARDAGPVRRRVIDEASLAGLWGSGRRHFGADVDVCAPVLRRSRAAGPVELRWGENARVVGTARSPEAGESWGPLLARCLDVPEVPELRGRPLGEVATTTAGFRDEFYALAAAARDPGEQGWSAHAPRLVTVGMIQPGRLTWGTEARRLGGRQVIAPRLDRHALQRDAPRVATWAAHRLRPKVLVATQTRVVEAVVDPAGDCVPVTPTISVEPLVEDARGRPVPDVWALAAALLAPPVAAAAAATSLGSGLSVGSIRWSARAVREVALPTDRRSWGDGTRLVKELAAARPDAIAGILRAMAPVLCRAYDLPADHPSAGWWLERALRV